MGCQGRKYCLRYGRLIDGRSLGDEQFDELRQLLRHLMDVVKIRFRIVDIPEVFIIEVSIGLSLAVGLLNQPDGVAHDTRHAMRLLAVAGTVHGGESSLLLLAEGGDNLLDPSRIIIAEIAQVARQGEDEGVAGAMLRFAAKQHYQLIYEILIGYALVFCGEHFKGCHSASSLIISSRAEMRIISRMAISRLGRLNSSASMNSVIAVSALKSIILNIVITLNIFIILNIEL